MRLPPVRDWRLHLGVHKTATTHLQDTLALHHDALAERGIDYIPMPIIRANRIPDLRRRNWRAWVGGAPLRAEVNRKIAPHRSGRDVVVMSAEDWVGSCHDLLAPVPYPRAARRLGALGALAGDARLTFYLSIRSWDTILPAAYATVLRFEAYPGGFEPIRKRVVNKPPSWVDLVDRIRAAAPKADVRLWDYESYRERSGEIMEALCGCDLGALPDVPVPVRTQTPTASAITAAEQLDPSLPFLERWAHVMAIFTKSISKGGAKYAPFSEYDRSILLEAYEEQRHLLNMHSLLSV
jgi:hypothetical protein